MITGETGAGKSILVDALALLAGGRGSSELIREGASRLTVSGEFDAGEALRALLAESGLPDSERILVRRELSSDGRGRAFVEDEPASVRTLARLGERLLAIHGQSAEQELVDAGAPLELLDAFAKAESEREAVALAAARWTEAREALAALEAVRRERGQRLEMLEFQIREIETVDPAESEETDLPAERERLLHADRIRRAGETALAALSEDEGSAADRLGAAARAFAELAAIDSREAVHREEAEDLKRRIMDLAAAARDAAAAIEADPDRLTAIETRLGEIQRLKRKHGGSIAEILTRLGRDAGRAQGALQLRGFPRPTPARRGGGAAIVRRGRRGALGPARGSRRPFLGGGRQGAPGPRPGKGAAPGRARDRPGRRSPRHRTRDRHFPASPPTPGSRRSPSRRSPPEASCRACSSRFEPSPRERGDEDARSFSTRWMRASAAAWPRSWVESCRALAEHDQVLCVTHVPQIAALADRQFLAEKREVGGRTVASVRLLEGPRTGRRDRAHARRRKGPGDGAQARAHAPGNRPVSRDPGDTPARFSFRESGKAGRNASSGFSIVFVGVGAVGAAAAESAVRAGFGRLTLVDRDVVERSNLARQFLFDAEDAARDRSQGGRRGGDAWRRSIRPFRCGAVVADLRAGNARTSCPGTTSSSTGPTTSRRGSWFRTRHARSGCRISTRRAWGRRVGSPCWCRDRRLACGATSRRCLPRGRGRPATPSAWSRRCRRWSRPSG